MPSLVPWRPMHTAAQSIARIWLNHLTLGPILAEGRPGRWYAPNAARQVWRWYSSADADALEPFRGWLPYEPTEPLQSAIGANATNLVADCVTSRVKAVDPS